MKKCFISEITKCAKLCTGIVCNKSLKYRYGIARSRCSIFSVQNRYGFCSESNVKQNESPMDYRTSVRNDASGRCGISPVGKVTLRKATLEDEEAVLAFGDVYGGRDYLFALYSDFINDPDTYAIVAVLDDKVVGFALTGTFDGGQTVLKRAGRVDENYRGRGVLQTMDADLHRHSAEERSLVKYEQLVNTERQDRLIDHFQGQGYRPIYRKGRLFKSLDPSKFWSAQSDQPSTRSSLDLNLHEMNPQDLSVLFQAETAEPRVFPHGRLCNFSLGLRLVDENIPVILNRRGGAFYTMDTTYPSSENDGGRDTTNGDCPKSQNGSRFLRNSGHEIFHNNVRNVCSDISGSDAKKVYGETYGCPLTPKDARRVAMVTFHISMPTLSGYLYCLDLYAAPNLPDFGDHLVKHLQRHLVMSRALFPSQIGILTLAFDLHLHKDTIVSCLDALGVDESLPNMPEFLVLYEKTKNGK